MSTSAILRVRRDSAADWTSNNPTPEDGQLCFETDTGRFKLGDGATAWVSLAYVLPYLTATDKLLGRSSSGAGVAEEIACTAAGRALIDDADAAAQRTTLGFGTNLLQMLVEFHARGDASMTLTDVAAGDAFLGKSNSNIRRADLSYFTQVRFHCRVTGAATAGTLIKLRYRTSFSTTIGDYVDIGTSAVQVDLAATGHSTSSWIDLAAGAKADVYLAPVQTGGDGATDPAIRWLAAEFRRQ